MGIRRIELLSKILVYNQIYKGCTEGLAFICIRPVSSDQGAFLHLN